MLNSKKEAPHLSGTCAMLPYMIKANFSRPLLQTREFRSILILMTAIQEETLYHFMEDSTVPFTAEDAAQHIRILSIQRVARLASEIQRLLSIRKSAFQLDKKRWVSRHGYFEKAHFVIHPTRLELLNGFLIPGHRCVPFVNPLLSPNEYIFYWEDRVISGTTAEGKPEEFYPYYSILGEEYAPQYVAQDTPENESAFNESLYEDPLEVSLHVLDMREIYRKIAFEPGDCLSVSVRDWKKGRFDLQMVKRGTWQESALEEWRQTAESGFRRSFDELGPSSSTEEQITFAYWYGGRRMLELPAYSLEDFLYEKTNYIETVPYGLESRFWYAGREIPDQIEPAEEFITDSHPAEEILYRYKVPVSRFVIQAYIRDAFFRDDRNLMHLIERIAPAAVGLERYDIQVLMSFLTELIIEMHEHYIPFVDQKMGHFRQRIAELHTAIIELTAHLRHSSIEAFQLPHHTFITLSQLQEHTAGMLEDLDTDECPPDSELMILDVSIENMLDTYRDVRESIEESIDGFRWSTFSFESADSDYGYIIQTGIVGTEVWRQLSFPKTGSLTLMHECIQAVFRWNNQFPHRFVMVEHGEDLPEAAYIQEIVNKGIRECAYEYGLGWTLKIVIVSRLESGESIQCVAGNGAAPPEQSGGALHFQKLLEDLGRIEPFARERAAAKLGPDFNPVFFDVEQCNQDLLKIFGK